MKVSELLVALQTQNPETEVRLFNNDDGLVKVHTVVQAVEGCLVITHKVPCDNRRVSDVYEYQTQADDVIIWSDNHGK